MTSNLHNFSLNSLKLQPTFCLNEIKYEIYEYEIYVATKRYNKRLTLIRV